MNSAINLQSINTSSHDDAHGSELSNQDSLKTVHKRLHSLRKRRGMTMKALADATGTSQQQIDRLEKGKRRLTVEWLMRLSDALDCQMDDLLPKEMRDTSKTLRAKVVGGISTEGLVEWYHVQDTYPVVIGRPENTIQTRWFGLRLEHDLGHFTAGSELIFGELDAKSSGLDPYLNEGRLVLASVSMDDDTVVSRFQLKPYQECRGEEVRAVLLKTILNDHPVINNS